MSSNLQKKIPFIPGTNPKEISFTQSDQSAINQSLITLSENNTVQQIPINNISDNQQNTVQQAFYTSNNNEKVDNSEISSNYGFRFTLKNCSEKIILSPSGMMAQCSINDKVQLAVTNHVLNKGKYYFEILCPFSCENIQVGLVKEGYQLQNVDKNVYLIQKFKTTSQRTIGVNIDFETKKLSFQLNGYQQENKSLDITEGNWFLCVLLKDIGNCVILNTNCVNPLQEGLSYFNVTQESRVQKQYEEIQGQTAESLQKLIEKLNQKQVFEDRQLEQPQQLQNRVLTLQKSGNLLVQQGNKLKIIKKNGNGLYPINQSLFTNKPISLQDEIFIVLERQQLQKLLSQGLDWNVVGQQNYVQNSNLFGFFEACLNSVNKSNNDLVEIKVQYQIAQNFFQGLTLCTLDQIQKLQENLKITSKNNGNNNKKFGDFDFYQTQYNLEQPKNLTLDNLFEILNICARSNEQLFAMSLHKNAEKTLQNQFLSNFNRTYTTFGRLQTFLTNTNFQKSVVEMSEVGLYKESDGIQNLKHFECQNQTLEDIQNLKNKNECLSSALLQQIPESRLLNNQNSANVPLETTINNLPYQTHDSTSAEQDIEIIKNNQNSNIFSTISQDGVVNIWNSEIALQKIGKTDFKQAFKPLTQEELEDGQQKNNNNGDIGFNEPHLFKLIENSISDHIWVVQKPIQQIEKEIEEDPLNKADNSIVDQLVTMGFPIHVAQEACIKTKNKGVNDAMEIIFTIQEEYNQKGTEDTQLKQIRPQWNCQICTYVNYAPKTLCEMCESPASSDAYYSDAEIRKQQEAEMKKAKEAEIKKKQEKLKAMQQDEDSKANKEKIIKEQKEKEIKRISEIIESSKLSSSVQIQLNKSKKSSLILGAGFNSTDGQKSLIKLRRFGYNPKYLKQFYKPAKTGYICTLNNEWIVDSSIQGIENVLFGNDNNRVAIEALNTLYVENPNKDLINLSEQIIELNGEILQDLTWSNSNKELTVNLQQEGSEKTQQVTMEETILYVLTNKSIKIYQILSDYQNPYENLQNNVQIKLIETINIEQQQLQVQQLFVNSCGSPLNMYLFNLENKQQYLELNLETKAITEGKFDKIVKLINQSSNDYLTVLAEDNTIENYKLLATQQNSNQLQQQQQNDNNNDNDIDLGGNNNNNDWTQNLQSKDINNLEKLTQTQAVGSVAIQNEKSLDIDQQNGLFTKHTWNVADKSQKYYEIQFQQAVALQSVKLQGSFSQNNNSQKNIDNLNIQQEFLKENQNNEQKLQQKQQQEEEIQDIKIVKNQIQDDSLLNLSIQNETSQNNDNNQKSGKKYLPIRIAKYLGNSFKFDVYPSKMLVPNDEKFVSNYPNTQFVFENVGDQQMQIDSVTIHSSLYQRSAGYPIGSGLIFTSNYLSYFDKLSQFEDIKTMADYQKWRNSRLQISQELDQWEPVGFFEFTDSESEVLTFKLDYIQAAKYICLKPTNFRKTPKDFTNKYGVESLEIKFFGVQGQVLQNQSVQNKMNSQNYVKNNSDYDLSSSLIRNIVLEIQDQSSNQWNVIDNISENSQYYNQILNHLQFQKNRPQSLEEVAEYCNKNNVPLDLISQINISHPKLNNTQIKGLRISFSNDKLGYNNNFVLKNLSIQNFTSVNPGIKNTNPLEIRSALLDISKYEVLNKKLVNSICSSNNNMEYRKSVQKLLTNLMQNEEKLVNLVFNDLDLTQYLEQNVIIENNGSFREVTLFLQNFLKNQQMQQQFINKCLESVSIILDNIINENSYPYNAITPVGIQGIFTIIKWMITKIDSQKIITQLIVNLQKISQIIQDQKNPLYSILRQQLNLTSLGFEKSMFLGNSYSNTLTSWQRSQMQQQNQNDQKGKIEKSIPQRIVSQKSNQSRRIVVDLMNKYAIKDIQLCFGKNLTSVSHFNLMVWVVENNCCDKQLIHSKYYPVHVFLQLVNISQDVTYLNVFDHSTQRIDALGLTNLKQIQGRYLIFQINWSLNGNLTHNTECKSTPNMDIIPEIYGDYLGSQETHSSYNNLFEGFTKNQATFIKDFTLGESRQYQKFQVDGTSQQGTSTLTLYDSLGLYKIGDEINIPSGQNNKNMKKSSSDADQNRIQMHLQQQIDNIDAKLQENQDNLRGTLSEDNLDKNKVEKLLNKIEELQVQKYRISQKIIVNKQDKLQEKSLYFYFDYATIISQFLQQFVKNSKNNVNIELLHSQEGINIAFSIFETFLIQEQGKISENLLGLVKSVIIEFMSENEWETLIFMIIEKYLKNQAVENINYSHQKVVNLLNQLSVPLGEVLSYLAQHLQIPVQNIPSIKVVDDKEDLQTLQICILSLLHQGYLNISSKEEKEIEQLPDMTKKLSKGVSREQALQKSNNEDSSQGQRRKQLKIVNQNQGDVLTLQVNQKQLQVIRLNYDVSLITSFIIAVQTSKNNDFETSDKIAVLSLNIDLLNEILKYSSSQAIVNMLVQDDQLLFQLIFNVLDLNHQQLTNKLSEFINNLLSPTKFNSNKQNVQEVQLLITFQVQKLLQQILDYSQNNLQLNNNYYVRIIGQNQISKDKWLEHTQYILNLLIISLDKYNIKRKQSEEQITKTQLLDQVQYPSTNLIALNDLKEYILSKNNCYISVEIAENMIELLESSQNKEQFKNNYDFSASKDLWTLVLNSLQKLRSNDLLDRKLFQKVIETYMNANPSIQYPILGEMNKLSQNIISVQNNNLENVSFEILKITFSTIDNLYNSNQQINNDNTDKSITYQLLIGWLDVMLTRQTPKPSSYYSKNQKFEETFAQFNKQGSLFLLQNVTKFLIDHANPGGKDGIFMATASKISKLQLADDLLKLLVYSNIGKSLLSQQQSEEEKQTIQKQLQLLLNWYLMNRTGESQSSSQGVEYLISITSTLYKLFGIINEYEEICKLCLTELVNSLQHTDVFLLEFYKNNKISSYTTLSFSERISKSLDQLIDLWVTSDSLAQHVAFEIGGFEYLLDRMGIDKLLDNQQQNIEQEPNQQQQQLSKNITKKVKSDILMQITKKYGIEDQQQLQQQKLKQQQLLKQKQMKLESLSLIGGKIDLNSGSTFNNVLKDEEIASNVLIINQPGQIFSGVQQDWSTNKKGVRQAKIIECKMQDQYYNEYPVVISLKEPVEVKSICLGFHTVEPASLNRVIGVPSLVLLEGGLSLDDMQSLGNLTYLEDEGYSNFQVKVFGKNFETIQEGEHTSKGFQESVETLQCKRVKYLRFRLRRPQVTCIDNLSILSGQDLKNIYLSISFLSIQGYYSQKLPENIKSKIISTQQGSALQTIGKLCDQSFQKMLSQVASHQPILEKFQKSFSTLSDLLVYYEKWLSPLILGIAQHNEPMGDWILDNFLKPNNTLQHSNLACEIVLSNKKHTLNRAQTVLNFILKEFSSIVKNKQENLINLNKQLQNVVPFLSQLPNTLILSGSDLQVSNDEQKRVIKLSIEQSQQIVDVFSIFCSLSNRQIIIKLLSVLMYAPHPYCLENDQILIQTLDYIFQKHQQNSNQQLLEIITPIILGGQQGVNWVLSNNGQVLKYIVDEVIAAFNSQDQQSVKIVKQHINCLTALAKQHKIKEFIIKNGIDMSIFDSVKIKDANVKHMIKDFIDNDTIKQIVEFLKNTVIGNVEHENKFAQLLKEDIIFLSKKQDMNYVQQILVPLLNAEYSIPLCLNPFDKVNKRWMSEPKKILQYSKKLKSQQDLTQNNGHGLEEKQEKQLEEKQSEPQYISSLKSNLFANNKQKDALLKTIEKQSQKTAFGKKFKNGSWKLAHTQTSDSDNSSVDVLKNQVLVKAPYIVLLSGTNKSKKCLTGVFNTTSIDTSNDIDNYGEFRIPKADDQFMFYYEDNFQMHFDTKTSSDTDFGSFYEEDGTILLFNYNNIERILISLSDYEPSSIAFNLSEMPPIDTDKTNFPQTINNSFTFSKCEYWVFQEGVTTKEVTKKQTESVKAKILPSIQNNLLLPLQYYHIQNPLSNFRQQPVYSIPANMSLKKVLQLLQINGLTLNQKAIDQLKLKSKLNGSELKLETEVKDYYESMIDNNLNGIFDIEYDALEIFENTTEQKQSDITSEEQVGFISNVRIFEAFQKAGGVEKIIETVVEQTKSWKNQKRGKIWQQYVQELKSFSALPNFFSLFMSNKDCVELLFALMAGLPDQAEGSDKKDKDSKDWDKEEQKAVKYSYSILGDVFKDENDNQIRSFAYENNFIQSILDRIALVSKENPREWVDDEDQDEMIDIPDLKRLESNQDGKKVIRKKKGLGYGSESTGDNKKWDVSTFIDQKKSKSEQILQLLDIILKFLNYNSWETPESLQDTILQSCLLPLLETALNNSLVDMSKDYDLMMAYFKLLKLMAKHKPLVPLFFEIDQHYKPKQITSLLNLLERAKNLASIFQQVSKVDNKDNEKDKEKTKLPETILETYEYVNNQCQVYSDEMFEIVDDDQEEEMKRILDMPLQQKYKLLLEDLRFDYVSMKKGNNYDHHYKNDITNTKPTQEKLVRLAQELADISTGLPSEHTNAIFARTDTDRVDVMKVCIMGSNGTPYAHGAYIFDVYFNDSYPQGPPKVNLSTTGSAQVRFNPNLYACGKVCLSLLGTWRGQAAENWDAKISTLLQVLVSIQSIIMAEEVYFNEPGHEHEAGTEQGEKYNEGYSNIVRYCNIKFAMLDQIKNPPKGFESVIKRHFYLKREEILQECEKWIKYSKVREANYSNGLLTSHNSKWCSEFSKSKDRYREMLEEVIGELKTELENLEPPSFKDLKSKNTKKQKKTKKQNKVDIEKEGVVNLDTIDIGYEEEETKKQENIRDLDINDEKVKDRWSRYIGAMGIDAVAKQSKCSVFLSGLGSLGVEIAKNIILGGVKRFTIHDDQKVQYSDLAGQFFVGEQDIGKNRALASVNKIQQLNYYVKVDTCLLDQNLPTSEEELDKSVQLKDYNIVILIGQSYQTNIAVNNYCRKRNIKFMAADLKGPFATLFNDFGDKFEVVDKNGEDPTELMVKHISNDKEGVVTLLDGLKHPYEDGDQIVITSVEGMDSLEDDQQQGKELEIESEKKNKKSINGSIHKIIGINSNSFKIGDTTGYGKYIRNGIVKNIKVPVELKFESFENTISAEKIPFDENMQIHDFMKFNHSQILHVCFSALDLYKQQNKQQLPEPWNLDDMKKFQEISLKIAQKYFEKVEEEERLLQVIKQFAFSCGSQFPPLAAFMGGYISQEIVKAITNKYLPTKQYFYTDSIEVLPNLPEDDKNLPEFIKTLDVVKQNNRLDGVRQCFGSEMLQKIQYSRIFMIGCGAIGCELLKNFAMINLFTGAENKEKGLKPGLLTITDPDHIENSNLNRQFLFREKHIRQPKSSTGAAVAQGMNPLLKGHVHARLDKIHEGTVNIYSDEFFGGLTMVANALDNVAARRYVDQRCVSNKIPLLESGTLGPKGHVQVIIPHETESYGSQQDPGNEDGEIPHCTLKMFPEETLHCVEWSRDKFGKLFTLRPKSLLKIIEDPNYQPAGNIELKALREAVKLFKNRPQNFEDCIKFATYKFFKYFRNDIRQLLYTYPPDLKTKDGEPFWKLPKRPPQEINEIDPENKLHCAFISSVAVMRAKLFKIKLPQNYRSDDVRKQFTIEAAKIKVPDFKPSESKAKQIANQVDKDDKKKDKNEQEEEEEKQNQEEILNFGEECEKLLQELKELKNTLSKKELEAKDENNKFIIPEEFEKDEDQNGHIDYIYALANMRSTNYKLELMDWIQVKLKAGRIVPALATTTAAIAGLQTIELIKVLKKEKTENMKNAFLNLAVPILQLTEPGAAAKIKLHDDLTVNLWDRWDINVEDKVLTLNDLFEFLTKKYKLACNDLFLGNKCIFSGLVMNMKGKEKEKEKALNTNLQELLDIDKDQKYSDLTITFSKIDDEEKNILKDTPPVRVYFKK